MINTVDLYIEGVRVDLFDDETIEITDVLKDLKDPKLVFTSFSMPFTVPASATNNSIFKHWYNPDIVSGFDARTYKSAEIRVGGIPYKKGKIALNEVAMKNNSPSSYSINFVGQTRGLKDLIKDDKLTSLTYLDKYDHSYSDANVLRGFTVGLNESGGSVVPGTGGITDMIYPFIYHAPNLTHALTVNTTPTPDTVEDQAGKKVYWKYLKPSMRVLNIIDAIEDKYGVTFSTDFFTTSNAAISTLYMHLHNKKGQIAGGEELQEQNYDYSATTFNSYALPSETQSILLDLDITNITGTGDNSYGIQVIDDISGEIVMDRLSTGDGVDQSFNTSITAEDRDYQFKVRIYTEGGISGYDMNFAVNEQLVDISGTTDSITTLATLTLETVISTVKITSQVPDISVIEFLTGLFKMFNLVAYYMTDTNIYVNTLDGFYADSSIEWDISEYANFDSHSIKRSSLYGTIDFGWKSNDSYLITRRNEELQSPEGKGYGYNLYYGNTDNIVYDGKDYDLTLPFEKFLFERISNDAGALTPIIYGLYLEDDDEDPDAYKGAPLLFYATSRTLGASDPSIQLHSLADAGFTSSVIANGNTYDSYQSPGNTNSAQSYMINWDSEVDEYTFAEETNSLFQEFYSTYIENIFDSSTRIFNVKAELPQKIITQYELNDRIILWGKKFKINSITVDLIEGSAELELITE